MPEFVASTVFSCDRHRLFEYHQAPGAIERLIPPWEDVQVIASRDSLEVGSEVLLRQKVFGIPQQWRARHVEFAPEDLFADTIEQGPFRRWLHRHEFESLPKNASGFGACRLTDRIAFELPLAPLSNVALPWVKSKLAAMFAYRHRITADDIAAGLRLNEARSPSAPPVRIAITGSSGLVGQRVTDLASVLGWQVVRILRPNSAPSKTRDRANVQTVVLDPAKPDTVECLEGLDAVIHLAGYGIGEKRWTDSVKKRIASSRIETTQHLTDFLSRLESPPRVLVSASGIGIFGDRGDELLSERSASGNASDFLVHVANAWEAAARRFEPVGRVAIARLGVVLHPRAGALAKLLPLARMGLGGPIGSGRQHWPWIHIDDAANILLHLAVQPDIDGVYHGVSPQCPTQRGFAQTLGSVLRRPAFVPAPAFAMRTLLGEMAGPLLLSSTRATTERLISSGYVFRFPELQHALQNLLGVQSQ
jgi:uncharacterized protein (TIGR01777 family)